MRFARVERQKVPRALGGSQDCRQGNGRGHADPSQPLLQRETGGRA